MFSRSTIVRENVARFRNKFKLTGTSKVITGKSSVTTAVNMEYHDGTV